MSDRDKGAAVAARPQGDQPVVALSAVGDRQREEAERFVEEEEGAVSRFRGVLALVTTTLLVASSLFHLYAAIEIVPAQTLRPSSIRSRVSCTRAAAARRRGSATATAA